MSQQKLRPGVFSSYTVGGSAAGLGSRKAGVIAAAAQLEQPVWLTAAAELAGLSGQLDNTLQAALELLFRAGVAGIYLCPATEGSLEGYQAAFALAAGQPGLDTLLCDSGDGAVLAAFAQSLAEASGTRRERIGVGAVAEDAAALQIAGEINSERLLLAAGSACCKAGEEASPMLLAAALAGRLLNRSSPDVSLNAAELPGIVSVAPWRSEEQVERLLAGGVTPCEWLGGRAECIRAVSTRTRLGEAPDATYRDISTVLIIDDIMRSLREMLNQKLRGVRSSRQSLDSIASQVTVLLGEKEEAGLIREWEQPRVLVDAADPSLCIVSLSFGVAHVVSRIQVQATVTI